MDTEYLSKVALLAGYVKRDAVFAGLLPEGKDRTDCLLAARESAQELWQLLEPVTEQACR